MNEIFVKMFSSNPNKIISGDYCYYSHWYEKASTAGAEFHGITLQEYTKQIEDAVESQFDFNWQNKIFTEELKSTDISKCSSPLLNYGTNCEFQKIAQEIAQRNSTFLDIASSGAMGLTPYILKLNPQIPCLMTDISISVMKGLRRCVDKYLSEYNISLAAFDNYKIPLKDESLEYVTSLQGITSSFGDPEKSQQTNPFHYSDGKEQPLNEVYRILKPGGYFITIEMSRESRYDKEKIDLYYRKNNKLFEIYNHNEINEVCNRLETVEESWENKFLSAGFEIHSAGKYYRMLSLFELMNDLRRLTRYYNIHPWEQKTSIDEIMQMQRIANTSRVSMDEIGLELFNVNTLFILRKPT